MRQVAVIGYASIDYPAVLDGFFEPDRTTMIRRRPAGAFPRPGGCPLYVAGPMAAAGIDVSVVTWVGSDDHGRLFTSQARRRGIGADGIGVDEQGDTPVCFVIHQADGSCGYLFDPGMLGRESLTDRQKKLIAAADLLCFTVGPPQLAQQALELIGDECEVAWVSKNDPLSYPEDLRMALGSRAGLIFCNRHEREWVNEALARRSGNRSPMIVETDGANPVTAERNGVCIEVAVQALSFDDATGAGDTLSGGCLAAVAAGQSDLRKIVERGVDAAAALLRGRSDSAPES
ncbi:MAG: carbohydrate kinase family protein [Gammaproteobacteria bacterium]|nr:carbohydrate kinase family protein [Gammaproteobacteria bacterium]MCY4255390.1 carbohydrate kinase family protein [Gammaproteobacteria bacterium]